MGAMFVCAHIESRCGDFTADEIHSEPRGRLHAAVPLGHLPRLPATTRRSPPPTHSNWSPAALSPASVPAGASAQESLADIHIRGSGVCAIEHRSGHICHDDCFQRWRPGAQGGRCGRQPEVEMRHGRPVHGRNRQQGRIWSPGGTSVHIARVHRTQAVHQARAFK
jgi:hypothetical protein